MLRAARELFAEVRKEPQNDGEGDAQDEAGDDRKVERRAFAVMNDVSGQAAEAEGEFGAEGEECAQENKERSEHEKRAAEIAERVHGGSLRGEE